MDAQNLDATIDIGARYHDLAVETTGAEQGRVKHVGTVGCGNDDDAFIRLETVHFDEQLVQRLFALVILVAKARATAAADSVDFVDEDDAGGVLLGLVEHVADARRTNTDKHFDKVRTRNGEEGNARLTGNRARQQGLSRTRRTNQQRTLRNLAAKTAEFVRVFQEFDNFLQFFARFIDAGDIVKSDAAMFFGEHLGLGFAKAHRPARSRRRPASDRGSGRWQG